MALSIKKVVLYYLYFYSIPFNIQGPPRPYSHENARHQDNTTQEEDNTHFQSDKSGPSAEVGGLESKNLTTEVIHKVS